jgi:multidrug efflux pump subunit AcrB
MESVTKQKRGIVEWAMHYRSIVILVVSCLCAFGVWGLADMRKNEFPDFTVRQGIVVAVCPGQTASEIEEQVTKPLEDYIFQYKEVKKAKTHSSTRDGIAYIQVQLNDNIYNKDEFWSKFKHGISEFKVQLPQHVVAIQVVDDFGDTSALLITMESEEKTYRELDDYMDLLKDRLRKIEAVGRMTVSGMQNEQISVVLDNERLAQYGLTDQTLALTLFSKGFTTMSGRMDSENYRTPIYVAKSFNTLRDVQELIIFSDPMGNNIRLKDVATVKREYADPDSYIRNNGRKCLLLSVEMKKGKNIVQMGTAINEELQAFQQALPSDVTLFRITDQSDVVARSVRTFLKELMIAICAVVFVVMMLLPIRTALVAASTIPITIFISLGLFYALGMELNTVTLAALIVTLGMIVDNSIVIIDSYMELLAEGMSRWHASITSAEHFARSIFSATLAISVTFFPFLLTTKGMINDFASSFPWAVTIVLMISLLVALMLVPFLQFWFIRKPIENKATSNGKRPFSFLDWLQNSYNRILSVCFRHPYITLVVAAISIGVGMWMMTILPQRMLPTAERNQFAVEIYLPTGSSTEKTAQVADSLEHIMRQDDRVVSVASFIGCASPRFQNSYAPQIAGTNYAQFIVNTKDSHATEALLDEFTPLYSDYFPEAIVRIKQLSYSEATYPIEVRVSGNDRTQLVKVAREIEAKMRNMKELRQVRTSLNEPLYGMRIALDEDESTRLGVSNSTVEMTMAMRYGSGTPVATLWDGDYDIPVMLKSTTSDDASIDDLANEQIPVLGGITTVPLRQVASVEPHWYQGQLCRRNGVPTVTIFSEVARGLNEMSTTALVQKELADVMALPLLTEVKYQKVRILCPT